MKKILITIILILILLVNVQASIKGDVNLDGKVTSLDFILVKNHILGNKKLNGNNLTMADVNNDKKVNSLDYVVIKNIILNGGKMVDVSAVIIDKTSASINVGESITLKGQVSPSDATNKILTWTSSDNKIASVDNNGKVTGIKDGEATITVKSNNGKTATCKITVKKVNLNININVSNGIYDTCKDSTTDFYDCSSKKDISITSTNSSKIETIVYKKNNSKYELTNIGTTVNGKSSTVSLPDGEYLVKAYPIDANGNKGSFIEREYTILSNQYQNLVYSKNNIEIRAGVQGKTNLFEPNKDFVYYFKVKGQSLNGQKVTNTIKSKTAGLNISKTDSNWNNKVLQINDNKEYLYTGKFNVSKNGVYTIQINIGSNKVSFDIGIIPKNKMADKSNFYYGLSPYLERAYTWGANYRVQDQSSNKSIISLLETAKYMGINVIRNGDGWATLQGKLGTAISSSNDPYIDIANKYGFTYLWTIGNKRSDIEYYKSENLHYYKNFIEQIAKRYASNNNIIWEIWNEPDLKEFFGMNGKDSNGNNLYKTKYGNKDQYLAILKTAATAIKKVNPNAIVSAGGLAVYYDYNDTSSFRAWKGESIFKDYANLLSSGLINTYAIHNHKEWHNGNNGFIPTVNSYNANAKAANLTRSGVYITESGTAEGSNQAYGLACKILWYRARGYKMFMQFSMMDLNIDNWNKAIFSRYLQPRDAVIAYSTIINMIGNASYRNNIAYDTSGSLFADIYYNASNNTSIIPIFSAYNSGRTIKIPSNAKVYDMYGNLKTVSNSTVTTSVNPVYVVVSGTVTKNNFIVK